jgi:predicted transcriptional regulator
MYELIPSGNPQERKKLSFSTLLTTGRQKQIKKKILVCLNDSPMTARQLSETIPCMRSSVCSALLKLSKANLISDKNSIFDAMTKRNVTLYSLNVKSYKERITGYSKL